MKRIFKFCFDDEKEINKENINLFIFINCYSEIIKKAKS